jgi:uncharacterized membrane protein YraQ (UPF0718 family)
LGRGVKKGGGTERLPSGRAGWRFLGAVLLLHLLVRLYDPLLSDASLRHFLTNLARLLPMLGVMLMLLWLFALWVEPRQVVERLGRQSGIGGWLLALSGGVISMGPMYLWYPVLGGLHRSGLRPALAGAFLYSRAIKIPLLPLMVHYFGGWYAGLFVLNILVFAVVSGLVTERLVFGRSAAGD